MQQENEVVQIMAVTFDFLEKSMELGLKAAGGLGQLTKGSLVVTGKVLNTIYLGKWKGKTSLNRFRQIKGDDMQFISIETEDKKLKNEILKSLKNHGILYAELPDLKQGDGKTQFVISPADMGKFEAFLVNHYNGKNKDIKVAPISMEDYSMTGYDENWEPTPEMQKLEASAMEELEKQQKKSVPRNGGRATVTIDQVLFDKGQSKTSPIFHSRIPYTHDYVDIPMKDCRIIENSKDGMTCIAHIYMNKTYDVDREHGGPEKITGRELLPKYDRKDDKNRVLGREGEVKGKGATYDMRGMNEYIKAMVSRQKEDIKVVPISNDMVLHRDENFCEINLPQSEHTVILESRMVRDAGNGTSNVFISPTDKYTTASKNPLEKGSFREGKDIIQALQKPTLKAEQNRFANITRNLKNPIPVLVLTPQTPPLKK